MDFTYMLKRLLEVVTGSARGGPELASSGIKESPVPGHLEVNCPKGEFPTTGLITLPTEEVEYV